MKSTKQVLQAYFIWLLVGAFSAYTTWMIHTAGIYLVTRAVRSPWRPFGWTSQSVVPYSRLSILVLGGAWLIYVLYLENRLQSHAKESQLWPYVAKVTLGMGFVVVICLALLRLLARN